MARPWLGLLFASAIACNGAVGSPAGSASSTAAPPPAPSSGGAVALASSRAVPSVPAREQGAMGALHALYDDAPWSSRQLPGNVHLKKVTVQSDAQSAMDRDDVEIRFRESLFKMRLCYAAALERDPKIAGRLVLEYARSPGHDTTKTSGAVSDKDLVACLGGAMDPANQLATGDVTIELELVKKRTAAKVGGRAIEDLTAEDVERASAKAGLTSITRHDQEGGLTRFDARYRGKPIRIYFQPVKATASFHGVGLGVEPFAAWQDTAFLLRLEAPSAPRPFDDDMGTPTRDLQSLLGRLVEVEEI